jgi:hypothetical protein
MIDFSFEAINYFNVEDNSTLYRIDFSQKEPDTPIFENKTGLNFIECCLINCLVPPDSLVIACNTHKVFRCSHLHDGLSYTCSENCQHQIDNEDIIVDGVIVDTIRRYSDLYY